jgi:N-acetylglucosamine transport system permease protein
MRKQRNRAWFRVLFLSPALFFYALFVLWPLVQSFQLSLFRYRGLSSERTWNGGANYEWIAKNKVFWEALQHNGLILAVSGILIFVLGLAIAHAMKHPDRLSKGLRSIFLFPQVISVVVVAVIWQFMLSPNYGLINAGLQAVGQSGQPWLAQQSTALGCVIAAFVWWALGFYVMLFTAGLRGIPGEIDEAAELDGAKGWAKFWLLTWPMLWSIKRIAAIYLVSNVLNIFALVYVMTQGGPDRTTETMLTYLYHIGFEASNLGRASGMAVVNLVVALGASGILFLLFRKNPEVSR